MHVSVLLLKPKEKLTYKVGFIKPANENYALNYILLLRVLEGIQIF